MECRAQPNHLGSKHSKEKSPKPQNPLGGCTGAGLEKVNVNEEVPKFAAEHTGKVVAIEWQDGQGWRRFLWCRRRTYWDNTILSNEVRIKVEKPRGLEHLALVRSYPWNRPRTTSAPEPATGPAAASVPEPSVEPARRHA
jgi:hypothetical protein